MYSTLICFLLLCLYFLLIFLPKSNSNVLCYFVKENHIKVKVKELELPGQFI